MTAIFPNETPEYRQRRDELLDREIQLRAEIEAVAALRRELPLGGLLDEDYVFRRQAESGSVEDVAISRLFGPHDQLLIYTMMFGPEWDAPCPSCTSIVDGIHSSALGVQERCAMAIVAAASPAQMKQWQDKRGWHNLPVLSGQDSDFVIRYAGFETDDPGLVSAINVFVRRESQIYHFWNSELVHAPMANGHPRHADMTWPMWNLLDMTPEGRGDILVPQQDFDHEYFSAHVMGESN